MKHRHAARVALLVAVTLASVAAAGPNPCCVACKQRMARARSTRTRGSYSRATGVTMSGAVSR